MSDRKTPEQEFAEAYAQQQAVERHVGSWKAYRIPKADPLNLRELRKILNRIGRYCFMKSGSRGEAYGRAHYIQHGVGKILGRVDLKGERPYPVLHTYWLSGWHVTSEIVTWRRAPDHAETWEPPQWLAEKGEKPRTHVSKVIEIKTRSGSTYQIRY
jgi:hypothetical protein